MSACTNLEDGGLPDIRVAAITVTYHPDIEKLTRQCAALAGDVFWLIVDNGSTGGEIAEVEALVQGRRNTSLVLNGSNLGLATALNRGAAWLNASSFQGDFLLLLDQDSEPHSESVSLLLRRYLELESSGVKVGCVGPELLDATTGGSHGFHQVKNGLWSRVYPTLGSNEPVRCENLNGSGTLVRRSLFKHLGGLDESLFIDHVDTDWSFRVLGSGHLLFGIPEARFTHSMGEEGIRFWMFGWRVWPRRSPGRHYYLFRNTVHLLKSHHVSFVWKFWAVVKMLLTSTVYLLCDPARTEHLKKMGKGLVHGIQGRGGEESRW